MGDSPQPPSEREIFDRAMELPAGADLDAFLDGVCCGDRELANRVAALVASSEEAGQLLKDEPASWASAEQPGQEIGNYKLEELVGEGAFGTVWLAEQLEPVQRRVAMKILKLGLDTESVVRRFELERQALAMMDYPNIANVYDAGATDAGRSYFVMEYLDGEPLFAYANSRKLTIEQRLELMGQVVAAVQHAHQKGIIHRDLKSTNILVVEIDGKPVPKVIDFGIAKLITPSDEAELTIAPGSWGTPAYMSPEQLAGDSIDTRSDIFSLGIILYQLLSGARAPRGAPGGGVDIAPSRRFLQMEPSAQQEAAAARSTSPRELAKTLKGELDWIVLRAAADEPARRYSSAGALSEDLALFRAGRPVAAGPPTKRYIVGKFVRRYRGRLAVAALALCALMAATVVSLLYAGKAQRASLAMEGALYESRLSEATALRQSRRVGQRTRALAAVAAAARIKPTPELRNEAIAAMALPDLELLGTLDAIPAQNPEKAYDFVSDLLLTARSDRREIQCRRVQTGEVLPPVPLPDEPYNVLHLNVSPGGAIVALYGMPTAEGLQDRMSFYEIATGREICHIDGPNRGSVGCLILASAPTALVPMAAGGIAEIDLETGEERRRIETAGKVFQISANATETRIVACLRDDRKIQLIDAASGAVTRTISTPDGALRAAAQSPDGRLLAYGGGNGMLRCQDLTRGGIPLVNLTGHRDMVPRISFVLGGNYLVTSSWDSTVRLWTPTGSELLRLEGGEVMASRDGEKILVVYGKQVRLFRLIPPQEITICAKSVRTEVGPTIAFSPDSSRAAISGGLGTVLVELPGARVLSSCGWRQGGASFDPDEKKLITTGWSGVQTWDLDTLEAHPITLHVGSAHSTMLDRSVRTMLAVDRNNSLLAAAAPWHNAVSKRNIRILDLADGATLADLSWKRGNPVYSLVFDPQGRWLAASYRRGDGFDVWGTDHWKLIANPAKGEASMKIAANHDGSLLVSGSPTEICLWDTSTWECVQRFPCEIPSELAKPVDFSPDGSLLACGFDSGRIQLRRVSDGMEVAMLTLPVNERFKRLKFSPDRRFLGVSDQSRAFFFDLEAIQEHLERLGLGMELP